MTSAAVNEARTANTTPAAMPIVPPYAKARTAATTSATRATARATKASTTRRSVNRPAHTEREDRRTTRERSRRRPKPREAFPQPVAPVRELRRTLLAAQDRIRRTGGAGAEVAGRDPPDAARDARLLEDRLRELGPGAVARGRDVVDAERALEDRPRRVGEVRDVGRATALIVDDSDLVALGAEPQHRAQEVVPRRPEQPRAAHDPRLVAGRSLAVQLRAPVGVEGRRRVRLDVRLALRPVEDVVRR